MRLTLLFVSLLLAGLIQAQHSAGDFCGTPPVDMEQLKANRALGQQLLQARGPSSATTFIPIRYKLVGRSDSSGLVDINGLLDMMRSINVDFAPLDIKFYFENGNGEPFDYYYNDGLYNDHAAQGHILNNTRSSNAISIYIPNSATTPGGSGLGVTLGYYSPGRDILVFKRSEVTSNSSTASHEIGHYFGLPHTFRGWDRCSWEGTTATCQTNSGEITIESPVTILTSPGGAPVELVTRGAGANCATAGDTFCDTPADYNLGFGWPNCNYTGPVQDRNLDPLRPDEQNFMGYFLNCNPYHFSDEQATAMIGNYNSSRRGFLRGGAPDVTDSIVDAVTYVYPEDDLDVTEYFDYVKLDWEDVEFAQYYFVEVSERRSFGTTVVSEVVSSSSITMTNLEPNEEYHYRVRPFNQVSFGAAQSSRSFFTSDILVGVREPEAARKMVVYPNPLHNNTNLNLSLVADFGGDALLTVRDMTGRTILQQNAHIAAGNNLLEVQGSAGLPTGAYVLGLRNDRGFSTRRFVVE